MYDIYGPVTAAGMPVCRGNVSRPESLLSGVVTQIFTMPTAASVTSAQVQVDPAPGVTVTATMELDGSVLASSNGTANGDTQFQFTPVAVPAGAEVTLRMTFSATDGKIVTVYRTGPPGGSLTVENSCADGAPMVSYTDSGLRAQVWAMT